MNSNTISKLYRLILGERKLKAEETESLLYSKHGKEPNTAEETGSPLMPDDLVNRWIILSVTIFAKMISDQMFLKSKCC